MQFRQVLIISLLLIGGIIATGCGTTAQPENHLFILSGQSNMTRGLTNAFTSTVENKLGAKDVTVVISMKSGRGLRFWVEDYQYAKDKQLSGKKDASNGEEYPKLLKTSSEALDQQKFDTVSFIWMQGESDAQSKNGLSKVYAVNFNKLYNRLKTDLELDNMYFVIGRISNYGLLKNQKDYSPEREVRWQEVRAAQVQVAESHTDGAWIDTDDLIGETNLHYLGKNPAILGERFANKAVELLIEKYGQEILNSEQEIKINE